ncbi:MAG: hypothetical protein ACRD1L_06115, partial [Terriglobales bacterium]
MAEGRKAQVSEVAGGLAARTADPEAAAAGLHRYLEAAGAAERRALAADPGLARALLTLLANSEFLAEALIQSPELLLWLEAERRAARQRPREAWAADLAVYAADLAHDARAHGLSRFKRREYLRIAWRDLAGQASLAETTQDLSWLADAILQQAYVWAWNDLAARYGTPQAAGGGGAELAVLGLGKLGGGELNYSSDIDLMFLYSSEGETAGGARATSNREFFSRLAQAITRTVSGVSGDGAAYRVDLRLRPGGREGEVALALGHALEYYHGPARDWELQMLIRARACAGSLRLAQCFLEAVEAQVYPARPDAVGIADGVRRTRRRISEHLDRHRALGRQRGGINVKLDPGGIRDIEFLAQYLQRLHGGREPWVRHGNTLIALQRLHDKGWLAGGEFQRLSSAYWLLRHLEHRLQLRLGQQTHTLPRRPERLAALAHSLGEASGASAAGWSGEALAPAVSACMEGVRRLSTKHLGADDPAVAPEAGTTMGGTSTNQDASAPPGQPALGWSAHGRRQWERLQRSAATTPAAEA